MYTGYYNFSHKPFELTPDPGVIFYSETHQEAISALRYGVLNRKGFLQLTGNVGTGKSTLLQGLIQSLDSNVRLCYIPNPNFTVPEFYYFLGARFGLEEFDGNKAKFIISLGTFLQECKKNDVPALLVVDEAQVLSLKVLEEIRLISNQELHNIYGVLSIFLVGQPELNELLSHPKLIPLRNRIAVRYHVEPLSLEETRAYIEFRLRKAAREEPLFSPDAYPAIHMASGGVPRTINILCDNALLAGFAEQRSIIDGKIIRECARELGQEQTSSPVKAEKTEVAATVKKAAEKEPRPESQEKISVSMLFKKTLLAAAALCLFIVTLVATNEYWGKIQEAGGMQTWFERAHVQLDTTVFPFFKKSLSEGRDNILEFIAGDGPVFVKEGGLQPLLQTAEEETIPEKGKKKTLTQLYQATHPRLQLLSTRREETLQTGPIISV